MGEIRTLGRSLLLCALISRYPEALAWARERLQSRWGQLALVSPEFEFHETAFYTRTMGNQLLKQFVAFEPGYLTEAKLVLATTKDRDHRIYLHDGIYAEVTLNWVRGGWVNQRWTYPDYQRADFQEFFTKCRDYLRQPAA